MLSLSVLVLHLRVISEAIDEKTIEAEIKSELEVGMKEVPVDGVLLNVEDGALVNVEDGVLLAFTDGAMLANTDGILLAVTDGILLAVTDGTLLAVTDGTLLDVTDGILLTATDGAFEDLTSEMTLGFEVGVTESVGDTLFS